jgi:hypothetical protein
VFRRDIVLRASRFIQSTLDDIAADAYWIFGVALLGPLQRVPDCFCRKAYYPSSTHARWGPMRVNHIVEGRQVLLSYLRRTQLAPGDVRYCNGAINWWAALGIAGVMARHAGIPAGLRRTAQRTISRIVAAR